MGFPLRSASVCHEAGASLRTICVQMHERGYRTKLGGPWRPSTIQAILRRAAG